MKTQQFYMSRIAEVSIFSLVRFVAVHGFKDISYLVVLLLCQKIIHLILFVEQVLKKLRFMGFGQIKAIHFPLRSPLPLFLLFTSLPLLQSSQLNGNGVTIKRKHFFFFNKQCPTNCTYKNILQQAQAAILSTSILLPFNF